MMRHGPEADIDESDLEVSPAKDYAAGVPAVLVSLERAYEQMGAIRTAKTLTRLNQRHGFDCPGCAWPETPGHRKPAEFCENGAKAVAEEATLRTVTPAFFAQHSADELATKTDYWLGQQGRITHPMVLRAGADHYEPIEWDDAYRVIADHLTELPSPDQAVFYTSGRTSNEAAFLYQLLIRSFGTNNMPDCSNMCHESSGTALTDSIGIGKGSVSVPDVEAADLILIAGQNPGTNHPRMLSTLEKAKANGARIIAINPLPEAGLKRFKDPQKVSGVVGRGVDIADEFLQIRLGGDMALFQGLGRLLFEAEDVAPGTVIDRAFVDTHCAGFDDYETHVRNVDLDTVVEATGLTLDQLRDTAAELIASQRTVICWAMGLTQHTHAVATIAEAVNILLARGMIGKRGAGVCPVRGHSNVQGDRTMASGRRCRIVLGSIGHRIRYRGSAQARFRHRRLHPFDARRAGVGVHGNGRQFRLGHTRHRSHRDRFTQLRTDGAGLDETQPQPRGPRKNRTHPPHPRPHRPRPPVDWEAGGFRRGFDVDGPSFPRTTEAGVRTSAQRSRHRVPARSHPARC